jgi:N-acetylglucosamine-6-sulfatase
VRTWHLVAAAIAAALVAAGCAAEAQELPQRPNIIFVLTDDQGPSTLARMDHVQTEIVADGRTFTNTISTFPGCCPARAVMQTGMYPHNTGVLSNTWPSGGYRRFKANGLTASTVGRWLDEGGYHTGYVGKYMNEKPSHAKVPGWDVFRTWDKEGKQGISDVDGRTYQNAYSFIEDSSESSADSPYFAFVSFRAPHAPYYYPDRYRRMFADVEAPKPPSVDEADVSDKPAYVRSHKPMGARGMNNLDGQYREA